MGLIPYPGFVGGSNRSRASSADPERTVNFYIEPSESQGAKAQSTLYPMAGLREFLRVAQGPIRALGSQDGRCFAIAGFKFYEVFADATTIARGDVALNDKPGTISFNNHGARQLFITTGREGYSYDLVTNVLTNAVGAVDVGGYNDGYFLGLDAEQSILKLSNLENGLIWDAADVLQRQTGSDNWIGMAVKNREIWLIGTETGDIFTNTGSFPFPFSPTPSGLVQTGTPAGFSIGPIGGTLSWIGSNTQGTGQVVQSLGLETQRISTHAVEKALQSYGDLSGAVSYTFQEEGHPFLVINIPSANATWVFDPASGLWIERLFWSGVNAEWQAHRGVCHCFAFGKHLIGDRSTGTIYEQSLSFGTDADGAGMRRERIAPLLSNMGRNIVINSLEFDMATGIGLSSGQGADPAVMLQQSIDNGKTYGNEIWTSAGRQGEYSARAQFRRLGQGRQRTVRVVVSDPVPWAINGAWIDIAPGYA